MWDAQALELSRHFRVLRYDRRGHGRSSAPPPPYTLADLGRDAIALLDALEINRTHFCGLSIGGLTGQWLGIHAGERLDKIVLCATATRIGTPESWAARIESVREDGLDSLRAATAKRWFSSTFEASEPSVVSGVLDRFVATSTDGYIGCCAALAGADLSGDLKRIANPVLAISGDEDSVCPRADLAAIATSVQQGQHRSLPGRHIFNIESASAFTATLLEFLRS